MRKIIKNAIQCRLCGDVIESTDRHNYVECKCGACAVDGGHDYLASRHNTSAISSGEAKYILGICKSPTFLNCTKQKIVFL